MFYGQKKIRPETSRASIATARTWFMSRVMTPATSKIERVSSWSQTVSSFSDCPSLFTFSHQERETCHLKTADSVTDIILANGSLKFSSNPKTGFMNIHKQFGTFFSS
jgi:hypothetical protein